MPELELVETASFTRLLQYDSNMIQWGVNALHQFCKWSHTVV